MLENQHENKSNWMANLFKWMAGADTDVLNTCTKAEQNKQIGIGSLILIPMTLSGISMGFAIFTISENIGISIILGCIWATFILIIDRFLVSTFIKTADWKNDIKSTAVLIRLLFALAVGFTVSHPLVIFICDGSIQRYLPIYNAAQQNKLTMESDTVIKNAKNRLNVLNTKIEDKETLESEYSIAINHEENGLGGYVKIGKANYKISIYPNRKGIPHVRTDSLVKLRKNTIDDKKKYQKEQETLLETVNKHDSIVSINVKNLTINQKADYLTRATTLSKMGDEPDIGGTVVTIKWFLVFFFWFVDILPLFFKVVLVKYGNYDQLLEEKEILERLKAKNQHDTDKEKTLLERYLAKYKYDMNRELGRINLEHIFRFKERKLKNSIYKDFSSAEDLKKEMEDNAKMD